MHEMSITTHLLHAIEEEAVRVGARRVVRIDLVVGERTGVVDDSLRYCFDLMTQGTVAEGARVEVRRVEMRFDCPTHGEYAREGTDFGCPSCHQVGRLTDAGDRLLVESMEIER